MCQKKKIACWGILLAVVLVSGVILSVNPIQARYVNTAVWNTVALPGGETVTSDCLRSKSDAPLTVLLGEISQEDQKNAVTYEAEFWLKSEKNLTGSLTWSVDKPEYLQVTMHVGTAQLQQGQAVELTENEPVTVTLALTATEKAGMQAHADMTVKLDIAWGGALYGAFTVDLAQVTPEDPVVPEQTLNTQQTTAPSEEEENALAVTEAAADEPAQTVGNEGAVQLRTVKGFCKDTLLPVMVAVEDQIDTLELTAASQDGTQLTGFSGKTCYSLDRGQSYYMLYRGGQIRLPVLESQLVLLDLSRTALQQTGLDLQLQACRGGALYASAQVSVAHSAEALYEMDSQILQDNGALRIKLSSQWADYTVTYGVEKLTLVTTQQGDVTQYTQIDPGQAGLAITVAEDPAGDIITVAGAKQRPEAGSYVLCVQWSDGDTDLSQIKIPFFVNYYQTQTGPETTGGAQQ